MNKEIFIVHRLEYFFYRSDDSLMILEIADIFNIDSSKQWSVLLDYFLKIYRDLSRPKPPKMCLTHSRRSIQIMHKPYMSGRCVALCVISVTVGIRLPICWILEGLLFFNAAAAAVCHLNWHGQVSLVRAWDWMSKILISSPAFPLTVCHPQTHSHVKSLFWNDSQLSVFTQVFASCLPSSGSSAEGGHILASYCGGLRSTCPQPPLSFPRFIPLCLLSSSTFICHHTAHMFPSHIHSYRSILYIIPSTVSRPVVHTGLWSCAAKRDVA